MNKKEVIELCDAVDETYRWTMTTTAIDWHQQFTVISKLREKALKIKKDLEDLSQDN